jgi:hypothetical protein
LEHTLQIESNVRRCDTVPAWVARPLLIKHSPSPFTPHNVKPAQRHWLARRKLRTPRMHESRSLLTVLADLTLRVALQGKYELLLQ